MDMMFNVEDLLASLQQGDSAEDMAQRFADALNEASRRKAESDAKEAERAAQEAKDKEMREDAEFLLDTLIAFVHDWMPQIYSYLGQEADGTSISFEELHDIGVDTIVEVANELEKNIDSIKLMAALRMGGSKKFEDVFGAALAHAAGKSKDTDQVLKEWLNFLS